MGKKAFRLRAVGDRGEPLTFAQAGIRNIVRIVDFLPYAYGVGLIVLFANGKGKRLGDLAAGTIVVKDSERVWVGRVPGGRVPPAPPRPVGAGGLAAGALTPRPRPARKAAMRMGLIDCSPAGRGSDAAPGVVGAAPSRFKEPGVCPLLSLNRTPEPVKRYRSTCK